MDNCVIMKTHAQARDLQNFQKIVDSIYSSCPPW